MAYIRKRGKSWYAEVQKDGKRVGMSHATKGEARAWAIEQEEVIDAGLDHRHTFADALTKYSEEVSPEKRGAKLEILRLKKMIRDMEFSKLRIINVTTPMLAKWRDDRMLVVSKATTRREMNLLASVFRVARVEWHWIKENPLADVRRPSSPPARRRGVTQDEIDRICLALGYDDALPVTTKRHEVAVAFLLAIETAMRMGEILGLTQDRVNLERRFVRLEQTKNGDVRDVPLSTRAVALIKKLDQKNLFTIAEMGADKIFRNARVSAKIADLHFHDSRSEGITRLSKKLDVVVLAKMIGHRDLRSLMFYFAESAEDIAGRLG